MFWLGVISVIQALVLPGLVISYFDRNLRWFDRLLLAVPLSLLFNYFEVLVLVLCDAYHRPLLILTVIVEVACLILLLAIKARQAQPEPIADGDSLATAHWHQTLNGRTIFVGGMLICVSLPFIYAAWKQVGTVFNIGDAVLSWNRWAMMWYQGEFPHATLRYPSGSQTYPQGIPILYSLTYQFIGDERVQLFAKAVAIAFPLFAFATFIRSAFLFKEFRETLLLGVAVLILLLSHGYGALGLHFVFGGYADSPMAYFGVFAIYVFLLLVQRKLPGTNILKEPIFYIAIVAISASALVKQTGVLLTAIFLLASYFMLVKNETGVFREKKVRWSLLGILIITSHWYLFKAFQINTGTEASLLSLYNAIIPGSFLMRPVNAVALLFSEIGWMWLPALIFGLLHPRSRTLAYWAILPIFTFWAFFASWDLRALFLAFPWIAIVLAAGCLRLYEAAISSKAVYKYLIFCWVLLLLSEIFSKLPSLVASWANLCVQYEQIPIQFVLVYLFGVVIFLLGVKTFSSKELASSTTKHQFLIPLAAMAIFSGYYLNKTVTESRLIDTSIAQEQEIGHSKINRFLVEFFSKNEGANQYMATSEQYIGMIPTLQNHFRHIPDCEDFSFLSDNSIKYYLYISECPVSARNRFEQVLGSRAERIKVDDSYVFYRIN